MLIYPTNVILALLQISPQPQTYNEFSLRTDGIVFEHSYNVHKLPLVGLSSDYLLEKSSTSTAFALCVTKMVIMMM